MKRTATIILLLLTSLSVNAQRNVDLNVSLSNPKQGDTARIGGTLNVALKIVNLGPDTLLNTDTSKFIVLFNGDTLMFTGSGFSMQSYKLMTNTQVLPGDSTTVNFNFVIYNFDVATSSFCVAYVPYNGLTALQDTIGMNNTYCTTITIANSGTGIGTTNNYTQNDVYPNPAKGEVFVKAKLPASTAVTFVLTNVLGQHIVKKDLGKYKEGNYVIPVQLNNVPEGMYLYRLISDGVVIGEGKLLKE